MHPDLTISAFRRRCGISISALRFYDQCGVLTPASVDGSSGYRFYDESQVIEAELLRDLRRLTSRSTRSAASSRPMGRGG